jgi:predicted alpha/beta superfamily hydrolase
MVTSRTYHALHLDIAAYPSERICYVILPEKLKESEHSWLESMAAVHRANFAVVSGVNWEDDLTPWKAPGLKGGEFTGKAKCFLEMLNADLFFNLEASMRLPKPDRSIVGVSLSGLFAVWASLSMPLFNAVGSVSGSLWYDGFLEWMKEHTDTVTERYYFSLGNKEKEGKNKRLASVEEATLEAVDLLKSVGKEVTFEYNEGNHFGPLIERIEKAIKILFTKQLA